MYITELDKIEFEIAKNAPMSMSKLIAHILDSDQASDKKKRMAEGELYYKGKHDILKSPDPDGMGANNQLVHQFHRILVDQKRAYIGNPTWTIKTQDTDASKAAAVIEQGKIQEYLGDGFDQVFSSLLKHSSNKGVEWLHPYWSPSGDFRYIRISSKQSIPIYDQRFEHDLVGFIRYYKYDLIDGKGQMISRRKVEWWRKTDVTYYAENEKGEFLLDPDYTENPAPHWRKVREDVKGDEEFVEVGNWGAIPFIPFRNNEEEMTDLEGVKSLIDNYDKGTSDAFNDLDDIQELMWVVKGFDGQNAAVLRENFKKYRLLIIGEGDDAHAEKAEIPTTAREQALIRTKRDTFIFGQGVDLDPDRIGDASGVALQFMYSWLDLKADNMITEVIPALKAFFGFIFKAMEKDNVNIETKPSDITFTFNKTMITNEKEQSELANASVGSVSEPTRLANDPRVDDVAKEIELMESEQDTLNLDDE